MGKEVVQAQLYETLHVIGVGQIDKTLPPHGKTLKNLDMTLNDNGSILVEWEEGTRIRSFTIGAATVKTAVHKDRQIVAKNNPTTSA